MRKLQAGFPPLVTALKESSNFTRIHTSRSYLWSYHLASPQPRLCPAPNLWFAVFPRLHRALGFDIDGNG